MTALAATIIPAFSMAAAISMAGSVASAVAGSSAFFRWQEFPVQSLLEFFFCCAPDAFNLSGEMERLASHRVVEVHSDGRLAHCGNSALNNLAF